MKLARSVSIALALLAVLAAVLVGVSARNYIQAMGAIREFRLALSDLELRNEGSPQVQVVFRVVNDSPIDIELDSFLFGLYLDGQFVGSNYEPFSQGTVASFGEVILAFDIPIESNYHQYLEAAREKDSYPWSVSGRYKLTLLDWEKVIWLDIRSRWSGT